MNINFIVSGAKELWINEMKDKFILDPFIYYELKKSKEIESFYNVETAKHRRQNKLDLVLDSEYINEKFEKYVPIIGKRLNTIHHKSFDIIFWRKALSISFERYITFIYEVYINCKKYFNPKIHKVNILSLESINPTISFNKQRDLFQHSHLGKEQIFSLYIRFNKIPFNNEIDITDKIKNKKKNDYPYWFKSNIIKIDYEIIIREFFKKLYKNKKHTIAIHGSFFSNKNLNELMLKSKGKIYPIDWLFAYKYNSKKIQDDWRIFLSNTETHFDDFDHFFFYTTKYFFPREFLEDFTQILNYYDILLDNHKSVKYITSEVWPSCSTVAIGLAYLKTRGIKHIYNEHNYFAHPYVNNELDKAIKLVDIFTSLGWYDNKNSQMIKSSSLFNFKIKSKKSPKYDICYITDAKQANMPQITPSYGESCENAIRYYEFVKLFFSQLSNDTIKKMFLREYPKNISDYWLQYDDSFMLQPYYQMMKKVDSEKETGKQSISKSKLVIIDYISTPYIESILSDVPTVFFHNKNTYYLSDRYIDFFDPLIECGICQNNPVKAAIFVEEIKDNPNEWWYSDIVRNNRKKFLEKNLSENNHLENYLLELC